MGSIVADAYKDRGQDNLLNKSLTSFAPFPYELVPGVLEGKPHTVCCDIDRRGI